MAVTESCVVAKKDVPGKTDETIVTRRFLRLVEHLAAQRGHARGWKTEVAEQLDIHPSHLSKIMSGSRQVGWHAAERAADRLGLDKRYFLDLFSEEPEPQDFFSRIHRHGIPDDQGAEGVRIDELEGLVYGLLFKISRRYEVPQRDWDELIQATLNLEVVRLADAARQDGSMYYMELLLRLTDEFEAVRRGKFEPPETTGDITVTKKPID